MKKLLLTHCSHSEIPLITSAKNLGWYVIATSDSQNAIGYKFCDENIVGDFFDGEFICKLAKDFEVDAIVSGCEDSAYLSAAYACEKLNFPGHDTFENAKIIHNKMLFRKIIRDLNLPTPKFFICKTLDDVKTIKDQLEFPLIVKPVDKNSGIGCNVCYVEAEIESAFIKAKAVTEHSEIILEKYLQGSNHAANVFLQNHEVVHSFFDDEQYYINPYLVAGASSPSNLYHYSIENVNSQLEKIAKHLDLVDGMFHVQFIVESDGTPFLIDPCRRIPGGLYILFSQYASGFNVAENVIIFETGGHNLNFFGKTNRRIVAREYIMTNKSGIIDKISIDESIKPKIFDRFIWAKNGDIVENPMKYKAGILFMEFENYDQMQKTLKNFYELVRIDFK